MDGRRSGTGCRALAGMALVGGGAVTLLVGMGAAAGLLRQDPQGMMLLAGALILLGIGVFVSAAFRGRG